MTELGTDVDEFLKRIRQLGEQTDREDALRAQALEQQIEEGRRRRQALRAQRARSQSPVKDGAATDAVKQEADKAAAEDTPGGKRVTSRKEQEILSTIENLVGPTRTLSLFGKDESPSVSEEKPRMPRDDVSKEVPQKETPGKSATGQPRNNAANKPYEADTPQARFRETIQRHADWHESRLTSLGADSKPSTPTSVTKDKYKSLVGKATSAESPSDTSTIKALGRPERPEPRQKPAALAPRVEKSGPAPPLPGPRPSLRSQENSPATRASFRSQDSPVLRPSPSSTLRAAPGFDASPRPTSTPSASAVARANTLKEPRSAGRAAEDAADDDDDVGPPLPPRSSPSLARSPTTRHKAMAESLRALREKHARTNSSTSADGETSPALPPRPSLAPSPRGSEDPAGSSTPPTGTQRHSLHMGQAPSPSLGPAPESASPQQQRSPSPTGLSRSPTRGGFVQSALKRDGTLRAARPASALLDGSVTPRMRPPVAPKPASASRGGATPPSSDRRHELDPEPQLEAREAVREPVREPVRDKLSRETSPADDDDAASSPSLSHSDSRRWSPARQTWLESALKRNPPAHDGVPTRAGTLRSPSPSRPISIAFDKPLPAPASTSPRPASTVFDKSPLPTPSKASGPTTPLTANKKPSLEPPTPGSTARGSRDIQVDTPKRATPPPTVAKKPSLDALASRGRSQQPDSEPEALQRLKTLRRSPDRSAAAAAAAAAARQAEEAEALQRLKSLRSGHSPERGSPASLVRNQDTPEALQRLGSLRPGRSPERGSPAALVRNQDTPEALQRLESLRPPKPPKPAPQQTAEAIEKLRALRPASPTKTEHIDESKIALERTISTLRPSRPEKHVPVDEVKVNLLSAKERLHSPARGLSATPEEQPESKPEPMPGPTPDRNKSRSFQDDLASALMRGPPPPPARGTSPALRKAATFDSADVTRTDGGKLVHRTKTRARGPKRRLPTSATASGAVSPETTSPVGTISGLAVAKTRGQSGQPASKVPPPIRKSSRAVSSRNPPPKPRKPSSSIAN